MKLFEKIRTLQSDTYEYYLPKAIKQLEKVVYEAAKKGFDEVKIPDKGRVTDVNYELNSEINCIQKVLLLKPNDFIDAVRENFELTSKNAYFEKGFGTNFYMIIDWSELYAE
ncbi:hypothetical protein [Macrococcus equi]|uniref:hypothetical protein n=1 Tax=Macrococcus equi TaxID=3395462 RepID=UPI0039BE7C40